jgi:hypothetical protein
MNDDLRRKLSMILGLKAKLTTIIIATVAVFALAGVGAVFAAQSHNDSSLMPHTSDGAASQQEQKFEAQGVIQQVTFDQGTTKSGSLVFLPNGKQATVNVTFTTATRIEVEGNDSSHDGEGANGAQQGTLQAGMSAEVEGTLQADGSVLARGIQAHVKGANDNDGNDDNDNNGEHHLVGVIQSVDQNAQTFVLLPDGQTTTVTIAFDSQTNMEDEHDDGGQRAGLAAGAHVEVETITRSDGSLYAKEIKPASNNEGDGDQGGDSGGDGHNGTPTPTATPGSGDNGGDNGGSGGNG